MRKRETNLMVRLTTKEKAALRKIAKQSGISLSQMVRALINGAAYPPRTA